MYKHDDESRLGTADAAQIRARLEQLRKGSMPKASPTKSTLATVAALWRLAA